MPKHEQKKKNRAEITVRVCKRENKMLMVRKRFPLKAKTMWKYKSDIRKALEWADRVELHVTFH